MGRQSSRQWVERTVDQGSGEAIGWQLDTTPWGGIPVGQTPTITTKVLDVNADNADVTSTTAPGAASYTGSVISLPVLSGLVAGKTYLVSVSWTLGTQTLNAYGYVRCDL